MTPRYVLINLESDGIPMVTPWETEEEARAYFLKQNLGGGPKTITLLAKVMEVLSVVQETVAK